jgi:SAM-dependent methyltransferase
VTTSDWDAWAARRDRYREWTRTSGEPVTQWLLQAVGVQPDDHVLELAAGAGDVGFALVERAGPDVRLISSDVSPAVVDVARRAASERRLEGIDFRVLDARRLDVPSASVDVVICRWGYMLLDQPRAGFREAARVLRTRGRLALSVWGDPGRNPWARVATDICERLGYEAPGSPTAPPGIFSLANRAQLRAMVEERGLTLVRMEMVAVTFPYTDADDYIAHEVELPGPRGDFFHGQPPAKRSEAHELAAALLEPFRVDAGCRVPGEALNVLAVKR